MYGQKRYIPKGMKITWICVSDEVYQKAKRIMKSQGYSIMRRMGQLLEDELEKYNKTYVKELE